MQLELKSKEIFYTKEWNEILNSLIKYLPLKIQFNLYELSQKANLTYDDLITDGASRTKQTYVQITNHLIYNDFVELKDFENVILTERGRQLVEFGSYNNFAKMLDLKRKSEIKDLWVKKNYFWIEFVKLLIGAILGILLTLVSQHLIC